MKVLAAIAAAALSALVFGLPLTVLALVRIVEACAVLIAAVCALVGAWAIWQGVKGWREVRSRPFTGDQEVDP